MRESIYPVVIGILIVAVVAVYNIWSGREVDEVTFPGGSKIKYGKSEKAPDSERERIPNSASLDISGDWELVDEDKPLRLVIEQNEKIVTMRVYEFDGHNTWRFQGRINGNRITGNSYHLSGPFSGYRGRGNLEVSFNRDQIRGSFVDLYGLQIPFLAHR